MSERTRQSLELDELLSVLRCPATGEHLVHLKDDLVNESGTFRYPLKGGVPDLQRPPDRLKMDIPWYEPWDDLDSVRIEYPEKVPKEGLPYHLDQYLAGLIPEEGQGRWLLEIGCGERQCESWMNERDYRYVGIDVDIRGKGPNLLADGHNLPFPDSSMDFCASMAVLEHVVSPITFANEVFRVLKPGGTFIGSAAFMYGFHDRASFHHMSHAGLLYVLKVAGFQVKQLWPDWKYPNSISNWGFRGPIGLPWRLFCRAALESAEWSFTRLSNLARSVIGKRKINLIERDIQMAGSVSFLAVKPE